MASVAQANPIEVKIYDQKTFKGDLILSLSDRDVAKFALTGSDKYITSDTIDWPKGEVPRVSGTFSPKRSWWKGQLKGVTSWKALDLSPMIEPLRRESDPIDQRITKLLLAKEEFEKAHRDLMDSNAPIEIGARCSHAEIQSAEQRLGFSLPKEHAVLLENVGLISIGDSFFMSHSSLKNAYDQMLTEWGTPKEAMTRLPKLTQEFLKSTVILFTEVGDGYGALLYKPGGKGEYYWLHQDTIVSPEPLKKQNGEMRSYSEALIQLLARAVFVSYDASPGQVVFRDSSSKSKALYSLEPNVYEEAFSFNLQLDWEKME